MNKSRILGITGSFFLAGIIYSVSAQMPTFEYLDDSDKAPPQSAIESLKDFCTALRGDREIPVFHVDRIVDNRFGACGGFCQDSLIDGNFSAIEIEIAQTVYPVSQSSSWITPPPGKYEFMRKPAGDESCRLYEEAKAETLKTVKKDQSQIPEKYNTYCVGVRRVENFTSEIGIRAAQPKEARLQDGVYRDGEEIFDVESGEKLFGRYNVQYIMKLQNGSFSFRCGDELKNRASLIDYIKPNVD